LNDDWNTVTIRDELQRFSPSTGEPHVEQANDKPAWWALHLRAARGETLSAEERRLYDEEMARQDNDAPPFHRDLAALKGLRAQAVRLAADNAELRVRLARLEAEQERLERALSPETRQLLGVGD
jgi:hypothetical protein